MMMSFKRAGGAVAAAALAAVLATSPAQAQPVFNPPLETPTALAAPVTLVYKPGSAADCQTTLKTSGPPGFPAAEQSIKSRGEVEPVEGGLRFINTDSLGSKMSMLIMDDGTVKIENLGGAGVPPQVMGQLMPILTEVLQDLNLHKKTVSQGQIIISGEAIATLINKIIAQVGASQMVQVAGAGKIAVTGESAADGRRAVVMGGNLQVGIEINPPQQDPNAPPPAKISLTAQMKLVSAIDVETGFSPYTTLVLEMPMPKEMGGGVVSVNALSSCRVQTGG